MENNKILYTLGHSNLTLEAFLLLLKTHSIGRIVDIRTIPKSRRVPWFNRELLAPVLNKADIRYAHLQELGGLRTPSKESPNLGLKSETFRGFADYMASDEFEEGLGKLNSMLTDLKTAVLCAEASPERCHRSLIADLETARGVQVEHILSPTLVRPHEMTPSAFVDKKSKPIRIRYPQKEAPQTSLPGMPQSTPKPNP